MSDAARMGAPGGAQNVTGGAARRRALRNFALFTRARPAFQVGLVIVAVSLSPAQLGPTIAPYPPETALPGDTLQPPSWQHPLSRKPGKRCRPTSWWTCLHWPCA